MSICLQQHVSTHLSHHQATIRTIYVSTQQLCGDIHPRQKWKLQRERRSSITNHKPAAPPHWENLLKQEVNNQWKHWAITGNKEEEAHNPSPRKICKEIQLHTVIQDQNNSWGIRTITGPMVYYQKCKPIQKVRTLSSIIKENKNIQWRNTH
jgi:hypothetical protein